MSNFGGRQQRITGNDIEKATRFGIWALVNSTKNSGNKKPVACSIQVSSRIPNLGSSAFTILGHCGVAEHLLNKLGRFRIVI